MSPTISTANPAWDWPAQRMFYPCLPNAQRDCRCDLMMRLNGDDCGIPVALAISRHGPDSRKGKHR